MAILSQHQPIIIMMRLKPISTLLLFLISLSVSAQIKTVPGMTEEPQPPTTSIVEALRANDHLPIEQRIGLYQKLKRDSSTTYHFWNEDDLTMYGYGMLWDDNATDALEIFKLIAAEFNSPNSYDSLGEAYLALDDKENSLANYRKALDMAPDNFNAEDQIYQILHPDEVPLTDEEKFAKTYTAAEYKADLDQLSARLLKVHPNALKFITGQDFAALIARKKSLMTDETTYAEFRWHCAEIIAALNCSHTSTGRFGIENKILPAELRFPVRTRLIGDQLFVTDPMGNAEELTVKDEILSINGVPISEVIKKIYRHISSQGYVETTKRHEFNLWGRGMIAYALNFPGTYSIMVKGKDSPLTLNLPQQAHNNSGKPTPKPCEEGLCFDVLEDGRTANLTIASFNYYPWNNLDVFTNFVDSAFQEIETQGIEHLIIDLRQNGGGSPEASMHLLRYLIDKPFTYFSRAEYPEKKETNPGEKMLQPFGKTYKGKLYFLIDGFGTSTTGHFMSLAKVHELGTIVGEELGSNQFCSAGQKVSRLSNTKVMYFVANNTHVSTATSLPDETGILPDHYISQGIDDYLKKVDTVMEFAVELTRK